MKRAATRRGPDAVAAADFVSDATPLGVAAENEPEHGPGMGDLIRAKDWSQTPLGPMSSWSPALRTMVGILLANRFPMLLWWGHDSISIYNDAYVPVLGVKHPHALGMPGRECWSEIYDVLRPLIQTPLQGGPSTWSEDLELEIWRHGFLEETHWTVAYSPVPDETAPNGIGGVLATVHEITAPVILKRRGVLLRELGLRSIESRTATQACAAAAAAFGRHAKEVPFALIYLIDQARGLATLASSTGVEAGSPAGPAEVELGKDDGIWPIAQAVRSEAAQTVEGPRSRFPGLDPARDLPVRALVLPIDSTPPHQLAGVLVLGLSPLGQVDAAARSFGELAASQLSKVIANLRIDEAERSRAELVRQSEARFRALVTASSDVVYRMSPDWSEMRQLVGRDFFADTAHPNRTWLQRYIHPEDQPRVLQAISQAIEGKRVFEFEHRVLRVDGSLGWTFSRAVPLMDAGGEIVEWIGTASDITARKQAEQVLRQSEMRHVFLLKLIDGLRPLSDPAEIQACATQVTREALGADRCYYCEIVGSDAIVRRDASRADLPSVAGTYLIDCLPIFKKVVEAGQPFVVHDASTSDLLDEDLRRLCLQMQTISLLNIPVIKQGKPAGILCITQCVPRAWTDLEIRLATESAERTWAAVERGRAESALRESEARLARVLEVETVGVMFWDLTTGRMTNANDAFLDLMGYSRQELEAGELTWQRLTPPEYVEVSLAELRKFKLSGRIGPYEKEYFHKDGSRHWLVFAGSSLGGDACVEFCVDISGRKRVEAALRESEERYRGLFESIDEGFCIIEMLFDENGRAHDYRFVEANPAFEVQTGLVGAKGRTIREMAPRLDERWFEIYGEVALSGQPIRFDEESNHMDPPRHYDVYAFRYGPAEKRQVAVLFNDVSARKRMDEALRKANRELAEADQRKNEFLAMLSHELRNPLAPIANSVYVIDRAAPGGEQAKRAIRVIDRQVTHMTRLIDELLDVTRISRGKVRLQRESLELNAVVRGTCEDFRELFQRHGIALEIAIPAEPVRVFADRTRIAQVVGNLLQNAVKFTPSGGWATLSLEATGGEAVIEVRDTGAGLDPGLLEKLFVPFMQADQTLDRSAGGLGLGLALVKGLVELHGGRVHAASDGPGRGAVFTMRLPLESKAGSGREVSPGAPRANQALKLLIVEDNKDAAVSLKEVLELTGYQVAMAFTGTEGVRMARALRPDAVLCDIGLPEIDGYGVARLLREDPSTRELFLVALSGYAAPEDLEKSRDAGFDHHVAKPPSIEALQTLLDHRGASRAETA